MTFISTFLSDVMIKKKQLDAYLEKRFSDMKNQLDKFSSTGGQEELHHFRVNVKKVKAVIGLMESTGQGNIKQSDQARLKKIFKQAGKIRTAYIELLLMKQYSLKNEGYFKTQQELIKQRSIDFADKLKRHSDMLRRVKKKLLAETGNIRDKSIKRYVKSLFEKLSGLFSSNKDDNEYHKARMVLKNLLYTYELFPEKLKKKLKPDSGYLDELQEVIGEWHDAAIALNRISRLSPASKPEDLSKRERELFQAMVSLTKDFNTHFLTK